MHAKAAAVDLKLSPRLLSHDTNVGAFDIRTDGVAEALGVSSL